MSVSIPDAFMQTASGGTLYYSNPRPEDICVEDIAHHLSHINRFAGATRRAYSVAEHSVRVSWYVEEKLSRNPITLKDSGRAGLAGLFHDAAEAYVIDLPAPLKKLVGEAYTKIEASVAGAIRIRFGLSTDFYDVVHEGDLVLLATEKRDLMGDGPIWTQSLPNPLIETILPWDAFTAREAFLRRYRWLLGGG